MISCLITFSVIKGHQALPGKGYCCFGYPNKVGLPSIAISLLRRFGEIFELFLTNNEYIFMANFYPTDKTCHEFAVGVPR